MLGPRQEAQSALFYDFSIEDHVPADHVLRAIDGIIDLSGVRAHLGPFYSSTGRPSIDPELMMRMLLVGYIMGIRSERRLCDEVHLNLAYRWFCKLDLTDAIPDHSTFSKNRHGRFRDSDLLRHVFESVVAQCIETGLASGQRYAADASIIATDANRQQSTPKADWFPEAINPDEAPRAVQEYLETLDDAAFGAASPVVPKFISHSDPASQWTGARGGPAYFAYSTNYLIDTDNAVILDVEPPHFECGGAGTQFHTSTVRAKVSIDLAGIGLDTSALDGVLEPLVGGLVSTDIILGDIDLYFEFGRVDGTILSADPATKTASVILAPSAIDLFLGGIDDAVFFNRSRPIQQPDVDYATVGQLDVSLLGGFIQESAGIRVKSFAQSAPPTSETLFFSPPYPQRQSTGDGASSFSDLIGTLARNLDVEVEDSLGNLIGPLIDTTIEPLVGDLVGGLLVEAVSPILDLTVDPLLGFFGVGIGEAEVSVSGVTSICTDYADCPVSGPAPDGLATADYGSPFHFFYETLYTGSTVPDTDAGLLSNATATGDDDSGIDDEDGVRVPLLPAGTTQSIEVSVTESGGQTGYLQAWVDWNGDGEFGPEEQIASDVTSQADGVILLQVAVPPNARAGDSFARFRWSSKLGLDPLQNAPDGEVEDLAVAISGLPRSRLTGQVFEDAGSGGATAHDGLRSGDEADLMQITVVVKTPDGQVLAVAVTDELGNWSTSLPAGYEGEVVVRALPPKGMRAISENNKGTPQVEPSAPNDGRIQLTLTSDSNLNGLGIGLVRETQLSEDTVVYTQSGQIALLSHDYVAGSSGSVTFSVEDLNLPSTGAASVALFIDENCNGRIGALVSGPMPVETGDRICIISRVATFSSLPDGAAITYQLVADTKLQDVGVSIRSDNIDRIIIGRESGGLVVDKTAENMTQSLGESRFNTARQGDVLLYRIRIVNTGTSVVRNLNVRDITPPYTSLGGLITQSLRISDGTECVLALPEVVTSGYVGGLKWECNGEVQPGTAATLEFTARVDN